MSLICASTTHKCHKSPRLPVGLPPEQAAAVCISPLYSFERSLAFQQFLFLRLLNWIIIDFKTLYM